MNKTNLSILMGLVVALAFIVGVSAVYPSVDDLWVENPFWNGLSMFHVELEPQRLKDYVELDAVLNPENSTLFIIGPYKEFSESEVNSIKTYLTSGGTLVLADDYGTGNQLLETLGIEPRFSSSLLLDSVFRERNNRMPRVLTQNILDLDSVVLNYASSLENVDERYTLGWSSPLSYLVDSENSELDEISSHPVIAKIPVSNGWLVLISDSSLFINSMIERGDNYALLGWLASDQVIIDEAHGTSSSLGFVKSFLARTYALIGFYEIRYTLTALMILSVLGIKFKVTAEPIDPVEELMQRHPEYDRRQLEWLEEQRRVHG